MPKEEHAGPPANPEQFGTVLGWFKDFFRQFHLAWKLLLDPRIPMFTKTIPFITMAYLISPVDLVPDVALGLGQLDDLAVLLIGLRLFVDVCPPDIVAEHQAALEGPQAVWTPPEDDAIIDVEAKVPAEKKGEDA